MTLNMNPELTENEMRIKLLCSKHFSDTKSGKR